MSEADIEKCNVNEEPEGEDGISLHNENQAYKGKQPGLERTSSNTSFEESFLDSILERSQSQFEAEGFALGELCDKDFEYMAETDIEKCNVNEEHEGEDGCSPPDEILLSPPDAQLYAELLAAASPTDMKIAVAASKLDDLEDHKALKDHLQKWGFCILETAKDGNCFLHALIKTMDLNTNPDQLRARLVEELRTRQDDTVDEPGSSGTSLPLRDLPREDYDSWQDYLDNMSRTGQWCDEKMLFAASQYLKRDIIVISSASTTPRSFPCRIQAPGDPVVVGHYHERHYVGTKYGKGNVQPDS
jgi:hypothetical protein